MDVALITGQQTVELLDFADPVPAADGVVVDIALCGVCGTDVHAWQSGAPYPPAICGHEWTGQVSAVGHRVTRLNDGDRVIIAVPPACGVCGPCRAGHAGTCSTVFAHATGRHRSAPVHGGFARSIAVSEDRVQPLTAPLSDVQAAQIEPLTVALHAVRSSGLRTGETAVVQGAGPIGLLTCQLARISGAGRVIVVEPNATRRNLALSLGADQVVEPETAAVAVLDATGGLGADIVFECAGLATTVQSAVDLARRGGRMCLIGLASGPATIEPGTWLVKEIAVQATLAYTHDEFAMAVGLVADGRVDVDSLHTATIGLSGLGEALAGLSSGSGQMKVLVDPRLP